MALIGTIAPVSPRIQLTVSRLIFLIIVCFLPAAMWCLFLAKRKTSLLSEFLSNLNRLGLLKRIGDEGDEATSLRVKSYIQKFEVKYGCLTNTARKKVLGVFCGCSEAEANAYAPKTLCTGLVPVTLSSILVTLGWIVTLPPWQFLSDVVSWQFFPAPPPSILEALHPHCVPTTLAFLGAYFFSLQMLFRRYVLNDLGGAAYLAISIRILVAVIGIWTVEAVGEHTHISTSLLLLTGFSFGMFPRIVWQVVATLFKRAAGVVVPSLVSQLPLSDLDGFTVWHETRLEEEDIENIPNMATADLVDLLLDTRLTPDRLIDWTDQAILYTQLGPQKKGKQNVRDKLRVLGIRTATSFLRASKVMRHQDRESLSRIISTHSKGETAISTLEAALSTNPNLGLILQWYGQPDSHQATPHPTPFGLAA
jgi:hypothetical protein